MQIHGWKTELGRLSLLTAVSGLLGLITGLNLWLVVAALLIYAGWVIQYLHRLNIWLMAKNGNEPPDAAGLWGQVLDLIHQRQREDKDVRQRLQSMVDYLRSSFAALNDAVVMLDPYGHIEWCNDAANALLGLRQPEDNGRLLVNLVRHPDFIRYFEKESYSEPLEMRSPANSHIHLSVTITFFGGGNRLLFARDVSRTKRLEQMRKDFVANVSHELRTPLTVISGYLETFAEHVGEDPRWQRAIEQMSQQSRRMQSLVNDLMLLSRLESVPNNKQRESLRLLPLMEAIREEALVAANGVRTINVECDDALRLLGSATELRSAFSNLAINAVKYTKTGGVITLRWYADNDHAYFQVEDNGIGIEPQHIPRLTERFYRVDESRSVATGGTGLGLAIVKHVLLRHRAELQVRSEAGKGSSFTCVFPLSAVEYV